jgi:hypothetical protein
VKLSTFLIADHAESVNGKLYVTGGAWNRIATATLPVVHNHLTVAVVLHVPWESTPEAHRLELRFVDEDGQPKFPEPIRAQFEAAPPEGTRIGDEQVVVLCFNVDGLSFESAGTYEFHLLVDDQELGQLSFQIVLLDAVPGTT